MQGHFIPTPAGVEQGPVIGYRSPKPVRGARGVWRGVLCTVYHDRPHGWYVAALMGGERVRVSKAFTDYGAALSALDHAYTVLTSPACEDPTREAENLWIS